jgi:hypothetical protein
MRIVRNIGHVKRRRRIGRLAALVGFLMLASTVLLIFHPTNMVIAYILLLVGFVAFNFGMQQVGKWSNTTAHPRNDVAIDDRLQQLSDKYAVLHYMQFGKKAIEHLLIYPGGMLVMTARDVPGEISVNGSRWRRKGIGFTRMFGLSGPQLGNPTYETEQAIKLVEDRLKEGQLEFDVSGLVVFTASNVTLDIEESDYPVVLISELYELVRRIEVDPTFKSTDRDALIALLSNGEELERTERTTTRRPVKMKRRAMGKP